MRGIISDLIVANPKSLKELFSCLASDQTWIPLAGGTDLMVGVEAGVLKAKRFMNLSGLKELRGITEETGRLRIGALATYSEIRESPLIKKHASLLIESAKVTGALAIQNRGTIGGNIANASPAADTPPSLLVYDAEVELRSVQGTRLIPLHSFYSGYKQTALKRDEVLVSVQIPLTKQQPSSQKNYYRKVGTRNAQAISKIVFAAHAEIEKNTIQKIRLAFGSVAPFPLRVQKTEDVLSQTQVGDTASLQRALDCLQNEISPIDDIRSTARFRRKVCENLICDFWKKLRA